MLETTVTAACPWPICLVVTSPVEKLQILRLGKDLQPPPQPLHPQKCLQASLSQDSPLVSQAPLVCGLPSYKAEEVSALLWSPC